LGGDRIATCLLFHNLPIDLKVAITSKCKRTACEPMGHWGNMHTFLRLSGAFALGIAGIVGASAADQYVAPVAPVVFRPPPPQVFNWTMCYLGGHVGWAFADNDLTGLFLS
jgi:hypothetical protein